MVTWTLTYKLSNVMAHIEDTVLVKPRGVEKKQQQLNDMDQQPNVLTPQMRQRRRT
jgi:hypothetical protein